MLFALILDIWWKYWGSLKSGYSPKSVLINVLFMVLNKHVNSELLSSIKFAKFVPTSLILHAIQQGLKSPLVLFKQKRNTWNDLETDILRLVVGRKWGDFLYRILNTKKSKKDISLFEILSTNIQKKELFLFMDGKTRESPTVFIFLTSGLCSFHP